MKKLFLIIFVSFLLSIVYVNTGLAQCSICAKSVQQLGAKPAAGFNSGIIYLMVVPYAAIGFLGYKWWKNNR